MGFFALGAMPNRRTVHADMLLCQCPPQQVVISQAQQPPFAYRVFGAVRSAASQPHESRTSYLIAAITDDISQASHRTRLSTLFCSLFQSCCKETMFVLMAYVC